MDGDEAIERQSEAVRRILVALVVMTGILVAARFALPRSVYRAVFRPLKRAEAAAGQLPPDAYGRDTVEAARLRRRFAALCRAIDHLIRRLSAPAQGRIDGPVRTPARTISWLPAAAMPASRLTLRKPDTS